jgi:hypothetical protein
MLDRGVLNVRAAAAARTGDEFGGDGALTFSVTGAPRLVSLPSDR